MFTTVSVIGGDLRQRTAAELMAAEGFDVTLCGFERGESMRDIYKALDAQAVILPVPVSFDGTNINMPFSDKKLSIRSVAERLNPSATVFGGGIKPDMARMLEKRGIKHCDYLAREELAIRNAVPTALAILQLNSGRRTKDSATMPRYSRLTRQRSRQTQ